MAHWHCEAGRSARGHWLTTKEACREFPQGRFDRAGITGTPTVQMPLIFTTVPVKIKSENPKIF